MIDNGVNLIDTAPVYGNGYSEMVVGQALKNVARDKIYLSTKVGLITDYHTKGILKVNTYKNIMREIQSSLLNLHTDYIDFYFVHWPDVTTPIAETMTALNELKKDGIIRFIGVSNFSVEQIQEAQKYAAIDVQQPPYSMVKREFEELIKWGYGKGISSMTYGSLGSGILSGTIRVLPEFDKKDLRVTFYDFFTEPKFSKIMDILQIMDKIALSHKKTVAQVAINWSTQKEFVGTALIGVRNEKEVEENCSAFDWQLSDDEIKLLDNELNKRGI
jgi:aryl-alcohol dehydrogenase-like predicted oxidoreductase